MLNIFFGQESVLGRVLQRNKAWFIALNDDTKILTKTDTETIFTIPNFPKSNRRLFPKPKPILFFRDPIFRNRNRDFFPRPNFSQTENETFFPKPDFSKPKPKPSKIWQKSRDRDLNRDFSTSFEIKFGKFGTYKQFLGPKFGTLIVN